MEFFEPLTWNEDGIVALALLGMIFLLLQKRPPDGQWRVFLQSMHFY
jgi:hypothetical protein